VWSAGGFSLPRVLAWPITFVFVNLAWVMFRALDFACVQKFINGFSGVNGWAMRKAFTDKLVDIGLFPSDISIYVFVLCMFGITLVLRNSQEILNSLPSRKINLWAAFLLAASVLFLCIPDKPQEFIYFQF